MMCGRSMLISSSTHSNLSFLIFFPFPYYYLLLKNNQIFLILTSFALIIFILFLFGLLLR